VYVSTLPRPSGRRGPPSSSPCPGASVSRRTGRPGTASTSDLQLRLPGVSHQGRYAPGSSVLAKFAASQSVRLQAALLDAELDRRGGLGQVGAHAVLDGRRVGVTVVLLRGLELLLDRVVVRLLLPGDDQRVAVHVDDLVQAPAPGLLLARAAAGVREGGGVAGLAGVVAEDGDGGDGVGVGVAAADVVQAVEVLGAVRGGDDPVLAVVVTVVPPVFSSTRVPSSCCGRYVSVSPTRTSSVVLPARDITALYDTQHRSDVLSFFAACCWVCRSSASCGRPGRRGSGARCGRGRSPQPSPIQEACGEETAVRPSTVCEL
jgi:hypothetical protein